MSMNYLLLSFFMFFVSFLNLSFAEDKLPVCIKLKKITVDENNILNKEIQTELFKKQIGKCIDKDMFDYILTSVSTFYMDNGYITTRPYLKEQNIKDGEINIFVSKGLIEDIVDSTTKKTNWSINTAFVSQKNKPLNLRDLETSLEMINRIPSVDAKFEIKPGVEDSTSIVEIVTEKSFPYHFLVGITGEKYVYDRPYLNFELSIDNPFGINDILTFKHNTSSIQEFYQSSSANEINYSFSIGSYLVELIWFNLLYDQTVIGLNDSYVADGKTKGATAKISKILLRNQNNIFKSALSVEFKNSENYFASERIDVSSYKTSIAQIDFSHTYLQNWGQLYTIYSYYHGTNWFGARDDSHYLQTTEAKLQFVKHTLNTNLLFYFRDRSYTLNSNIFLQYSKDYLYDNNKIKIGSFYTVRGYSSSYYGSTGGYLKNDLTKTFYPDVNPDYIQTISPYVGLDYGEVKCENDNIHGCGYLVGSSIGIKTQANYISSDFTISRAIKNIQNIESETLFRYNLILKF